MSHDIKNGLDAGFFRYLTKPIVVDARQALKQKTGLALLYPILVTVVAIMIVTGLLVYVVPQVVGVFQQSRQSLPLLTRALIGLSDFLRGTWPYLVTIIVGGAVAARMAPRCDKTPLARPVVADALAGAADSRLNTSRFASTLAILVGGGVPRTWRLRRWSGAWRSSLRCSSR